MMSAVKFSGNNDCELEGSECLHLDPVPDHHRPDLRIKGNSTTTTCTCSTSGFPCIHKQEDNKELSVVEALLPLGRTVEGTACLFPNSQSQSDSTRCSKPTTDHEAGHSGSSITGCSTHFSSSGSRSNNLAANPHKAKRMSSAEWSPKDRLELKEVNLPSSEASNSESDQSEINIRDVPAKALNVPTRTRLSLMMNPPKVSRKDWTGLAGEMGFEYEVIENISLERDPMKMVLAEWTCRKNSTIGALLDMLEDLERNDVLLDITKLVERDARRWLERRKGDAFGQPIQDPEVSESYPHVPSIQELRGITLEDHPSGPPEVFDAYVCFTDVDSNFVKEMISVLEKEPYNLKLCVDFRDLVPGGSYSTITAEIIENRCKRMIIVLSPDFLASEQCDFQTKFAHSIAPGARNKRLIPVMVEQCVLPAILRHITICDYTKKDLRRWFWPRLYSSLSHG